MRISDWSSDVCSSDLLAELVVQLPEPYVNADWAQPGGSAAHAMYHLSLSANPSRVWSVDVGEGTGSVAHLLAQPIVVGDTVYTMDSRSLVSAFAATDGTRRWQVDVEDEDEEDRKSTRLNSSHKCAS